MWVRVIARRFAVYSYTPGYDSDCAADILNFFFFLLSLVRDVGKHAKRKADAGVRFHTQHIPGETKWQTLAMLVPGVTGRV